jgi:hypothetical protein
MRTTHVHPAGSSASRTVHRWLASLALAPASAASAADTLQEEIERDWLWREAARQHRTQAGISPASDALGGGDGITASPHK